MAVYTTAGEIVTFLGLSANEASDRATLLALCASVSSEWLTLRAPEYDEEEDVPTMLTYAATLQASRFYKRSLSPEGATTLGGDSVVFVSGYDRDVEALIQPFLAYVGFA